MIKVIEGKKHEEFVKDMCMLMFINDEHKINLYINNNLENNISIEDNAVKIQIKENEDTKYNIIYMLQRYRFLCICNEDNKDKRILRIMNNYLANYYMMTLFIDTFEHIKDSILQDKITGLKEQICNVCKVNISKFSDESDNNINDADECLNVIGAICACWNVLKKYDNTLVEGSNSIADALDELKWNNINETYSEFERIFNNFISEID